MPSHETVDLTTDGSAARILLNRPDALNAWNEQFGEDLLDAVTTVAEDESDPRAADHRRRPRLLLGRRPQGAARHRRRRACRT